MIVVYVVLRCCGYEPGDVEVVGVFFNKEDAEAAAAPRYGVAGAWVESAPLWHPKASE